VTRIEDDQMGIEGQYLRSGSSSAATEVVGLVQVVLGEALDVEEEERHSVEPQSSSAPEAADQT